MLPAMPDAPEPAPRKFALKPKEFERVNSAAPGSPPPAANDVFAIQRELREKEIASGMDELAPPAHPVKKRRARDYWFLITVANAVLIPLAISAYRTSNAVLFVYSIAAIALVNLSLTWVMWFVMDNY